MVHQGVERWDAAHAQLDWEALSLTKISTVPTLSSVGARSSHPNAQRIPVDALERLLPNDVRQYSSGSHSFL